MERYAAARPGRLLHRPRRLAALQPGAGPARRASTPSTCSSARRCRSTRDANSSTVTDGRLSGFGGAPNMGHDPHGRRHASAAWLDLRTARRRPARAQARRADRADLPRRRRAHVRRVARRRRRRQARRHAVAAGDDLRRRRHPRRHRGGRRLPVQGALPGRSARGAGRGRRRHPGRPRRRRATRRGAAPRRSGRLARGPRVETRRPTGPCWPPAASRTWSPGPAASTTRPHSSGTGEPMPPL